MNLATLNRVLLLLCAVCSLTIQSFSQSGCTDSMACNYDSTVLIDDGTCVYGDLDFIAVPDTVCLVLGENLSFDVYANDGFCPGMPLQLVTFFEDPCVILFNGTIFTNEQASDECCGQDVVIQYGLGIEDQDPQMGLLVVQIKCPKPDCSFVDLSQIGDDPAGDGQAGCTAVCENSISTLSWPFDPTNSYDWEVNGGTFTPGANDSEIIVDWGSAGSGSVILTVTNGQGIAQPFVFCIDIMESPIADFDAPSAVCLNQSVCFDNLSVNADSYFWEFGDGETSTAPEPCHEFTTPGTYTVTLTATNDNYDANGNQLCCCSDSYSFDIEVQDLEGPAIYWVSTLCEGDTSKYWTNATNCDDYLWGVTDFNGDDILFDGQGNDTICVVWGAGPVGHISLDVTDCDDEYCDFPTEVTVPIIPSVGSIDGPIEVCQFDTEVYSLPKWTSTTYNWSVTGGTIVSDNGGHSVAIDWGAAGTGTISVTYQNDFLLGLPNHDDPECTGYAELEVAILPEFSLFNFVQQACVGDAINVSVIGAVTPDFMWTTAAGADIVDNGSNADITFNLPGTYVIEASPDDPSLYCNSVASTIVVVSSVDPPAGIDGPLEICPLGTYYYSVVSPDPSVSYTWSVAGGSLATTTGSTVEVTWDLSGSHFLNVSATMLVFPFCESELTTIEVFPIEQTAGMTIDGDALCTNAQASYSILPPPHVDSVIEWTITDDTDGSVISGQGSPNIDVQWNNDAGPTTLSVSITLCGNTETLDLNDDLFSPVQPTIVPDGTLCNGITIDLDAIGSFVSYDWSTSDITPSTTIGAPGIYSVTTEDTNGCFATEYIEINSVPGPVASISTGDLQTICINNPHVVEIVAATNPDLVFEWFCNGVSQGAASPVSTFTHPFQGVPGTYSYYVIVTDTSTGCVSQSSSLPVYEEICDGDPCEDPDPYTFTPMGVNQFPNCNVVDFSFTSSANFTFGQWAFGDGFNSPAASPSHAYTQAGCYAVIASGTIPDQAGGSCSVSETFEVCIPIAAEFDFDYLGCTLVSFDDFSTYIDEPGNMIDDWFWDFGPGTSTDENPTYDFPGPGTYPVTLTVSNANGCEASVTYNVIITSVGIPVISAMPDPVCAGISTSFSAPASGAVYWTWDFDDGATFFGPNPEHTYLVGDTYNVTVTVEDVEGCTQTSTIMLEVYPGLPDIDIAVAPDLTICEGETTNLSVPPGYSYLWSNGMVTNAIDVGEGSYSVLITDSDGCTLNVGPVDVVEIASPEAEIFGNPVICDGNNIALTTATGAGNTYQWMSDGSDILGAMGSTFIVDATYIGANIQVLVTNSFGCSTLSDPVLIQFGNSPSFTLSASPDNCEGTPTTISVTPVEPGVTYTWSTGDVGTSIVTSQAGEYTVNAVNTATGCSSIQSITIVPAPEICSFPAGCYTTCWFDEVCADDVPGYTYQWNLDGSPLIGETSPCINVTSEGEYTVTVTNDQGCSTTSDPLILELIICDDDPCDAVSVDFDYLVDSDGSVDSCCVALSYTNDYFEELLGLNISSTDASFIWDLSSINTDLDLSSVGDGHLSLVNVSTGDPLPTGTVTNVVEFCLTDVINNPQTIVVDWYDFDSMIACSDSFQLDCIDEPDCLYLLSDSIYCEGGLTLYEMTVCNPADADFPIGYIDIVPSSPVGIVLTPPVIDITIDPILPGECRDFVIQLSGPGIANSTFCYQLIGHKSNPIDDPTTLCCSLDDVYCIDIPACDPCADIGIEDVHPTSDEDCCYEISIYNGFEPDVFDEIAICVISPATTMTINNPFGSGWTTSGFTGTSVSVLPDAGTLPLGVSTLPEICIETSTAPDQLIEIKWLAGGTVLCSDTVAVSCDPPCGYIANGAVGCKSDGWVFQGTLFNTSDYTVSEAVVFFDDPALSAYNTTIDVDPLLPGGSFSPFEFLIGYDVPAGTEICFTVTLHEINADGQYLSCCNFEYCFIAPECDQQMECLCGDVFAAEVDQGIDFTQDISDPSLLTMELTASNLMTDCDQVIWYIPGIVVSTAMPATDSFTTTLPGGGSYTICARVIRTQSDGFTCVETVCEDINIILPPEPIVVFPNPSQGMVHMKFSHSLLDGAYLTVYDNTQRPVLEEVYYDVKAGSQFDLDLSRFAHGMYIFVIRIGQDVFVERVIIEK